MALTPSITGIDRSMRTTSGSRSAGRSPPAPRPRPRPRPRCRPPSRAGTSGPSEPGDGRRRAGPGSTRHLQRQIVPAPGAVRTCSVASIVVAASDISRSPKWSSACEARASKPRPSSSTSSACRSRSRSAGSQMCAPRRGGRRCAAPPVPRGRRPAAARRSALGRCVVDVDRDGRVAAGDGRGEVTQRCRDARRLQVRGVDVDQQRAQWRRGWRARCRWPRAASRRAGRRRVRRRPRRRPRARTRRLRAPGRAPSCRVAAIRRRSSSDASTARCIIASRCACARRARASSVHTSGISSTKMAAMLLSVIPRKPRQI